VFVDHVDEVAEVVEEAVALVEDDGRRRHVHETQVGRRRRDLGEEVAAHGVSRGADPPDNLHVDLVVEGDGQRHPATMAQCRCRLGHLVRALRAGGASGERRTTVLTRLEARTVGFMKSYMLCAPWTTSSTRVIENVRAATTDVLTCCVTSHNAALNAVHAPSTQPHLRPARQTWA